MTDRIFLLGIGPAKTGTTWLSAYLRKHPNVWLPWIKELHYYDISIMSDADYLYYRQHRLTLMEDLAARIRKAKDMPAELSKLQERIDWLRDFAFVEFRKEDDFWYRRLFEPKDEHKVFGEFTASYGLIDTALLKRAASMFPNGRIVIMLRDPVARIWSHLRFRVNRGVPLALNDVPAMAHHAMNNFWYAPHSRYDEIIAKADAAVGRDRVMILFYEDIFFDEGGADRVDAFVAWLGLPPHPVKAKGEVGKRVNASTGQDMPAAFRAAIQPHFADAMKAVEDRMGYLPPQWVA